MPILARRKQLLTVLPRKEEKNESTSGIACPRWLCRAPKCARYVYFCFCLFWALVGESASVRVVCVGTMSVRRRSVRVNKRLFSLLEVSPFGRVSRYLLLFCSLGFTDPFRLMVSEKQCEVYRRPTFPGTPLVILFYTNIYIPLFRIRALSTASHSSHYFFRKLLTNLIFDVRFGEISNFRRNQELDEN